VFILYVCVLCLFVDVLCALINLKNSKSYDYDCALLSCNEWDEWKKLLLGPVSRLILQGLYTHV